MSMHECISIHPSCKTDLKSFKFLRHFLWPRDEMSSTAARSYVPVVGGRGFAGGCSDGRGTSITHHRRTSTVQAGLDRQQRAYTQHTSVVVVGSSSLVAVDAQHLLFSQQHQPILEHTPFPSLTTNYNKGSVKRVYSSSSTSPAIWDLSMVVHNYLSPDTSEHIPTLGASKLVLDLPTPEGWKAKLT